jgi:hypothetical protein
LVLERLWQYKLYLCHDKCEFAQTKIEYLRLIISHGQAEMDPVKIAGVVEWPTPGSKKEVQSFLGFTNFYRHFIKGFSDLARPLFDLTQNNSDWHWEGVERSAFEAIRKHVVSAPILIFPNDSQPFRVEVDSSNFATGAVLSQQSPSDNMWHPVAYYSKSLNAVERNYEIHDKEMLAIIRALEDWCHFLEGARHKFEVWTDHKNLEYFMSVKKLNRRQACWSLYLSRFNFDMHHCPGRSMGKSDTLSHRADHGTGGETMTTSPFYVQNSLQLMWYVLSPDCHLKERNRISLGKSGMQTMQASKRMLSHGLQETSGNPKGSLSGRWNGRNTMDYCVSGTASMFQMIWSYVAALHCNTMTPRLQATPDAGKPWSLSPGATGGHRCRDTLVSILGHVTSVSGRRSSDAAQLESSIRSPFQRTVGTSSAWTSLVNFRTHMDTMPS